MFKILCEGVAYLLATVAGTALLLAYFDCLTYWKHTMKNDQTIHLSFATLTDLTIIYSYDAADGEYWCEITEVYRGRDGVNLQPYLADDVLSALELQIVYAQAD